MNIDIADLRTEAAIWSVGTEYDQDDLIRLYMEHVEESHASGVDPKYPQRFFGEDLKIPNE